MLSSGSNASVKSLGEAPAAWQQLDLIVAARISNLQLAIALRNISGPR